MSDTPRKVEWNTALVWKDGDITPPNTPKHTTVIKYEDGTEVEVTRVGDKLLFTARYVRTPTT